MHHHIDWARTLTTLHIPLSNKRPYWCAYLRQATQRFAASTFLICFLQYLILHYTRFTYPALPLYPPIGSAFVILYILGNTSIIGLILGSFCAYYLSGVPLSSLSLYMSADLIGAYLGTRYCQSVFTSDIALFTDSKAWLQLIKRNAFGCCTFSSLMRISAVYMQVPGTLSLKYMLYYWLNFWLSDLNAIIIFSGFFLPWITVYWSNMHAGTYRMLLIMTALSYALSLSWLAYIVTHQQAYLTQLGLPGYTLISGILCIGLAILIYWGSRNTQDPGKYTRLC